MLSCSRNKKNENHAHTKIVKFMEYHFQHQNSKITHAEFEIDRLVSVSLVDHRRLEQGEEKKEVLSHRVLNLKEK